MESSYRQELRRQPSGILRLVVRKQTDISEMLDASVIKTISNITGTVGPS
jgi:hypothetical protein